MPKEKKTQHVEGNCELGFEPVRDSFRKNFEDGWELAGAAFAVYHKGQKVVDLWGGWAEKKYNRPWREDTLTTIFSCTKSISAICMAILVDRGHCDYSDLITKHWPEFGHNGKESITIEMLMAHKAGLPYFDVKYTLDDLVNTEKIEKMIENEIPKFPPGTKTAYQAFSYGHVIDAVFRKIEPKNRSIGQFFRDEVADKHHVDLHIGDCAQEESRIARLTEISNTLSVREFAYDRTLGTHGKFFYNPKGNFAREMKSLRNFGKTFTMFNNPEMRLTGQPAANGIATARGLAQAHQLLLEGTLVSQELLEKLSQPVFANEFDHTIGEVMSKGHGFMYTKSPSGDWQIGHSGVGGQIIKIDRKEELVIAYLTNGMKAGSGEHVFTCNRLTRQVYKCIQSLREKKSESE